MKTEEQRRGPWLSPELEEEEQAEAGKAAGGMPLTFTSKVPCNVEVPPLEIHLYAPSGLT